MRTAPLSPRLGALLAAALAGCGAPTAGSPCGAPSTTQCSGARTLLVCEGSTWAAYDCPSCTGSTCDWKGAENGAACPQVADGDGWCPYDGRLLGCYRSSVADAGVFLETACPACVQGQSLRELGRCTAGRCTCQ